MWKGLHHARDVMLGNSQMQPVWQSANHAPQESMQLQCRVLCMNLGKVIAKYAHWANIQKSMRQRIASLASQERILILHWGVLASALNAWKEST
jgi:hypothetical protein